MGSSDCVSNLIENSSHKDFPDLKKNTQKGSARRCWSQDHDEYLDRVGNSKVCNSEGAMYSDGTGSSPAPFNLDGSLNMSSTTCDGNDGRDSDSSASYTDETIVAVSTRAAALAKLKTAVKLVQERDKSHNKFGCTRPREDLRETGVV